MNWVRQEIKNKIVGLLVERDTSEQQLRMLAGWTDTKENFRILMKEMEECGAVISYWDMDELVYKGITTKKDVTRMWLGICASNSDKTVKELLKKIGKDESWLWELNRNA